VDIAAPLDGVEACALNEGDNLGHSELAKSDAAEAGGKMGVHGTECWRERRWVATAKPASDG
jgi:hypothetical protein